MDVSEREGCLILARSEALFSQQTGSTSCAQGVLAVEAVDLKGNPTPAVQLKGSLTKGKKGTLQELHFSGKGEGLYEALLPKTETALGTHE